MLLLLVVVSFELELLQLRGSNGLSVWISLSKEFVKLNLLQSGQVQEHKECINCL